LTDVTVVNLPELFESLAREAMKEHEKRFLEKSRGVRDAGNSVEAAASKFEAAVRNSWGTMDKAVSEYGIRMAQTIEENARKLSQQPTPSTYESTEKLHVESVEGLNKIIKTVRRYLPKLRRGLRVEIAALNGALNKLELAVRSLGEALDQSPGSKIELTRREILHFKQQNDDLLKLRANLANANASLEANASKAMEVSKTERQYISNDAFQELARYEDLLRAKEAEIKQFLQPLVKPLAKLERNDSGRRNTTLDIATLHGLVDRPVETVTTNQPFVMIQLLDRLGEALAEGRIEIEERKRRKAEETILQSKAGAIQKLREDYLTIQANVQETIRQLRTTGLLDKKNEVDQLKATIGDQKDRLTTQITDLNRRIENANKTILKDRDSLQDKIRELTGKEIQIHID